MKCCYNWIVAVKKAVKREITATTSPLMLREEWDTELAVGKGYFGLLFSVTL